MADLILGPPVSGPGTPDFTAWLATHAIGAADAAALARDFGRLGVYRRLVRATLRDVIELAMPRAVARLGGLFDETFERFLAERGPRTHYLRDVTEELLSFAEPLWVRDERFPPWAHELARHESLRVLVAAAMEAPPSETLELDLERGLGFAEAARVVRYRHAVHRLPEDPADRTEPLREATYLFVYRDREHEVRYLELTRAAAAILERLMIGESLGASVTATCEALGIARDPALLDATARLLADLAQRGALLGAIAASGQGNPELKDGLLPRTMAANERDFR